MQLCCSPKASQGVPSTNCSSSPLQVLLYLVLWKVGSPQEPVGNEPARQQRSTQDTRQTSRHNFIRRRHSPQEGRLQNTAVDKEAYSN